MSNVGPGAPPRIGPVNAHPAPSTAAARDARVEATIRAVKPDALSPLSAITVKYVSNAATIAGSAGAPCHIRNKSAAVDNAGSGAINPSVRNNAGTITVIAP